MVPKNSLPYLLTIGVCGFLSACMGAKDTPPSTSSSSSSSSSSNSSTSSSSSSSSGMPISVFTPLVPCADLPKSGETYSFISYMDGHVLTAEPNNAQGDVLQGKPYTGSALQQFELQSTEEEWDYFTLSVKADEPKYLTCVCDDILKPFVFEASASTRWRIDPPMLAFPAGTGIKELFQIHFHLPHNSKALASSVTQLVILDFPLDPFANWYLAPISYTCENPVENPTFIALPPAGTVNMQGAERLAVQANFHGLTPCGDDPVEGNAYYVASALNGNLLTLDSPESARVHLEPFNGLNTQKFLADASGIKPWQSAPANNRSLGTNAFNYWEIGTVGFSEPMDEGMDEVLKIQPSDFELDKIAPRSKIIKNVAVHAMSAWSEREVATDYSDAISKRIAWYFIPVDGTCQNPVVLP